MLGGPPSVAGSKPIRTPAMALHILLSPVPLTFQGGPSCGVGPCRGRGRLCSSARKSRRKSSRNPTWARPNCGKESPSTSSAALSRNDPSVAPHRQPGQPIHRPCRTAPSVPIRSVEDRSPVRRSVSGRTRRQLAVSASQRQAPPSTPDTVARGTLTPSLPSKPGKNQASSETVAAAEHRYRCGLLISSPDGVCVRR